MLRLDERVLCRVERSGRHVVPRRVRHELRIAHAPADDRRETRPVEKSAPDQGILHEHPVDCQPHALDRPRAVLGRQINSQTVQPRQEGVYERLRIEHAGRFRDAFAEARLPDRRGRQASVRLNLPHLRHLLGDKRHRERGVGQVGIVLQEGEGDVGAVGALPARRPDEGGRHLLRASHAHIGAGKDGGTEVERLQRDDQIRRGEVADVAGDVGHVRDLALFRVAKVALDQLHEERFRSVVEDDAGPAVRRVGNRIDRALHVMLHEVGDVDPVLDVAEFRDDSLGRKRLRIAVAEFLPDVEARRVADGVHDLRDSLAVEEVLRFDLIPVRIHAKFVANGGKRFLELLPRPR